MTADRPQRAPFADAIARARAGCVRAERAGLDRADLGVAIGRGQAPPWWSVRAQRWPELAGCTDEDLPGAERILAGVARTFGAHAGALDEARNAQREALAAPDCAALGAELDGALHALAHLRATRTLPSRRAAVIPPVLGVIDTVAADVAKDPTRAPSAVAAVLRSAQVIAGTLALDAIADLPAEASSLVAVRATLAEALADAVRTLEATEAEHAALEHQILERMG